MRLKSILNIISAMVGLVLSLTSIEGFGSSSQKIFRRHQASPSFLHSKDTKYLSNHFQNQTFYAKVSKDEELLFKIDDDDNGVGNIQSNYVSVKGKTGKSSPLPTTRWGSMNPEIKKRIIEEGQKRAIRNKQKREPIADKKRRLMMFYKDSEVRRRREARVTRPLPTNSPDRIPLSQITPGSQLQGTVISMVDFGVYVDVQTECDGLLHISQITRADFIAHPKQVFKPGDSVTVRVLRVSPDMKKLQLTMLSPSDIANSSLDDDDDEDRIQLEDLTIDDEVWGEIKRVTAFGAFVEVGAKVDGFLHFMDHPEFGQVPGAKPSAFMRVKDRLRCWVSDINLEKNRIKLTANRPASLPGPRREFKIIQ